MNAGARAFAAASLIAAAGCAAGGTGAPFRAAHAARSFDRIVVPAMTTIYGVAANDRFLFISSRNGLGILDRRFNEWLPPVTRVDGWPEVAAELMLADPLDQDAVWIVSGTVVYRYRVGFDGVIRTVIPSRTLDAGSVFMDGGDPSGGLVIRTSTELRRTAGGDTLRVSTYVRVSSTGNVLPVDARRLDPQLVGRDARGRPVYAPTQPRYFAETPAEITERYPALRGFERILTQDASLRTWPVLSAASSHSASQVWFGTRGGGVFQIDPLFARGDQMPFGLLGEGASALALGADGVWIGSAGVPGSMRDGLTFVDHGLRSWRWADGGIGAPFAGARVMGLSVSGSLVWAATTRGVVLLNGQSGAVIRRWDALSGLPSDLALAVEATSTGAWVGTTRGVAFITDDGRSGGGARAAAVGPTIAAGRWVRGLTRRGDTLWIASDAGVLVQTPGADEARRLRVAAGDARVSSSVAIATADSIVVTASDQGDVVRINVRTGEILDAVSLLAAGRVGQVTAVATDSVSIWVAGSRGLVVIDRRTRAERVLTAERDIPGDVYDVVLTPDAAWLGTDVGLVRLERLPGGLVR